MAAPARSTCCCADEHRIVAPQLRLPASLIAATTPHHRDTEPPMAENRDLVSAIDRLSQARVLCIGDVMLDHYVYGQVERVSPEAPIPVLSIEHELMTLGGAGNVLRNLTALGAGS